jgi:hypothetical protein
MELPQFVKLNHSCLRLVKGQRQHSDLGDYAIPSKYVRDAGHWEVRFKVKDGKVSVYAPAEEDPMHRYDNVQLTPTTQEEWAKDNAGFAPEWVCKGN